jgi:uncharacterized membrane protein HdeD (DUF308 family)
VIVPCPTTSSHTIQIDPPAPPPGNKKYQEKFWWNIIRLNCYCVILINTIYIQFFPHQFTVMFLSYFNFEGVLMTLYKLKQPTLYCWQWPAIITIINAINHNVFNWHHFMFAF